jgi:hypothetical protein
MTPTISERSSAETNQILSELHQSLRLISQLQKSLRRCGLNSPALDRELNRLQLRVFLRFPNLSSELPSP